MQHTIHQTHECSWSISQTKWNNSKLIMPIPGPERSLEDILFLDAYLVVSRSQVDLRDHCFSLQLIKQIINPQQRVPVLDGHFVQQPIFNAQSKSAIFLLYEQH